MDVLLALSNFPEAFGRLVGRKLRQHPSADPEPRPTESPARPARQAQTRLTEAQKSDLVRRYVEGERAAEPSKAFRVERGTVARLVSRAGVQRTRSMSAAEVAEAVQLYADRWSCERIAERLGRSHNTVRKALAEAGVQLRGRR